MGIHIFLPILLVPIVGTLLLESHGIYLYKIL